jgi:NAD(P)-dependent dehydrogenase (short-subunit alcohol dehydrogenase family)
MTEGLVGNPAIQAAYLSRVPLRRVGAAADVAEAVLYLSTPASSYVTGQLIDVDGGWGATAPSIRATE